ncbi:hypothetical protein NP233_g735 [Leucocoprinus birnbaumii]|uniref:Ceramide glucosyltransferase n=1 Tax=Leucocoprinus birnbaumii TaxID=56174 RepID=A0AAD5Z025_9AGAR|nr:hypothetical protein NP233_g735 [Leucocoprinus birnbaumii]
MLDDNETILTVPFMLAVVGLVWYSVLWVIGLLGCFAGRRYRLRPRSPLASAPANKVPGVSILRPLKGLDTNLYENLESTFTQEYPNYELLFSIADENDQALAVVRELIAKYPRVKAEIVIGEAHPGSAPIFRLIVPGIVGEEVVGVNPKVNNLVRSYRKAAHDIVWVLDSNVMVYPGTLARSVDALINPPPSRIKKSQKRIALVHHVPLAFVNEPQLGSRIEEAFLNTNHAKMYIAINTVALESCVVGKSNLYRRSDVDRLDATLKPHPSTADTPDKDRGLAAFGRFLAEDNMIASALWHELDVRHELSCDVARNAIGNMTLSDYIWRRVRWIRVRKHMVLAATILEPFTECIMLSLIASWCFHQLLGIPQWLTLLIHYPIWIIVDLDVYESLAGHPLPASRLWQFLGAWALRELLAFPIWCMAILGDEVVWRGKKYRMMRNGEVEHATGEGYLSSLLGRLRGRKRKDHYERLNNPAEI